VAKNEIEIEQLTDDFYSTPDVETLARHQGVGPLDFENARRLGMFWPEDESIDEFIATVRSWRDEESAESDRELS